MLLLLLAAAAVGYWAYKDGSLKTLRYADVAAGVAALIGLSLLFKGNPTLGIVALGGAGTWVWFRKQLPARPLMTETEALALLELPIGADADRIRAAHRRLIARVHPDAGGTADLARRVNLARDTLLAVTPSRPIDR
jgi:DnaJ family protein C protein 19